MLFSIRWTDMDFKKQTTVTQHDNIEEAKAKAAERLKCERVKSIDAVVEIYAGR